MAGQRECGNRAKRLYDGMQGRKRIDVLIMERMFPGTYFIYFDELPAIDSKDKRVASLDSSALPPTRNSVQNLS